MLSKTAPPTVSRPKLEVADVFRRYGEAWRVENAAHLSLGQRRVMTAIEICRTGALGGHVERCDDCSHTRIAYNSCRNWHCPKCRWTAAEKWLAAREAELLPVSYFHIVFTLPAKIGAIAYQNKAKVYGLLFTAAAETLTTIAADSKHLGADIGVTAVLHTWGQNLDHHPHLHCIVPGGGISPTGDRWVRRRSFWPCAFSRACSDDCFCRDLRSYMPPGSCNSLATLPTSPIGRCSMTTLLPCGRRNGSSLPSGRSPVPSRFSPISPATRTGSLSATVGSSQSTMATSPSAGRTIARMALSRGK